MIDGGQVDAIDIKGSVSTAGNKSQLAVVEKWRCITVNHHGSLIVEGKKVRAND